MLHDHNTTLSHLQSVLQLLQLSLHFLQKEEQIRDYGGRTATVSVGIENTFSKTKHTLKHLYLKMLDCKIKHRH